MLNAIRPITKAMFEAKKLMKHKMEKNLTSSIRKIERKLDFCNATNYPRNSTNRTNI